MGFRATIDSDINWRTAPTLTLPSMRGARAANAYGIGADPLRNLVDPTKRRRVRGALPILYDEYARFTPGWPSTAKSLWSGVEATPEWTWLMIARLVLPDVAGNAMLFSNTSSIWPQTGAAITGQAMLLLNETANNNLARLRSQCSVHDGAAPPVVTTQAASMPDYNAATAGWQIFVSRRDASGRLYTRIMGSNLDEAVTDPEPKAVALGGEIIIGSQTNAAATLSFDCAFDFQGDKSWTENELVDNSATLAEWATVHKGLSIDAPNGI
ncbi:hypothetical protein OVY48_09830 [Sphingobium sp. SA2]|uniref:hypothetical protein n=1 Tax=Sphingobium sp. SA2 TaxID=1524832 RepID=UPI0028C3139A|nr:hypothetical protein [Sphingobium sp. SA2]MDT7533722.1 hypothetical protein [Sphingobium sp. SA2]